MAPPFRFGGAPATAAASGPELLERADHFATLGELLVRVRAGAGGCLVFIGGEAGAGKTLLVRRFCTDRQGDTTLLWGACEALRTPRPLGPLFEIADSTGGALVSLLERGASPQELVGSLVATLRGQGPTVLVMEDVHLADEATLDVLRLLGRRISGTQTLVLVTFRDDELSGAHPLRLVMGQLATSSAVRRLRLTPLSPAAVDSLARRYGLNGYELHRKTAGNPFFVTEVLGAGGTRVPDTVRDAVLARTQRLSESARALLDAAAIASPPAEHWLLEEIAGEEAGSLAGPLRECLAAGVLTHEGTALLFRHELARHAIADCLLPDRRRELHRRALFALMRAPSGPPDLTLLVHHAEEANEPALVLRFGTAAADRAASLGAHREAAALYERALTAVPSLPDKQRAPLLARRAHECYVTGQVDEALAAYHQAAAHYQRLGDAVRHGDQVRWLSRISWLLGREDDANRHARTAVTILEGYTPGRELARAYSNLSQLCMLAHEPGGAIAWGRKAIDLADALGDIDTNAHARNNVGTAELLEGMPEGRLELEVSLDLAVRHRFPDHVVRAHFNLGWVALQHRAYAEATTFLRNGIAYADEHGLVGPELHMSAAKARVALDQGRWARAEELAQYVRSHPECGPHPRAAALVVLGLLRARQGKAEARELLAEASRLATSAEVPLVTAARAEAAWLRGRPGDVAAASDAPHDAARMRGTERWAAETVAWRHRMGLSTPPLRAENDPFALEIAGEWREAALRWEKLGCPYEAALALAAGEAPAQRESVSRLQNLGARAAARAVARRLQQHQPERAVRRSTQRNLANLTLREVEVLRLVARGLRNAQIADRLVVSTKTVDHHISAILRKLGVSSRGEARVAAARLGFDAEFAGAGPTQNGSVEDEPARQHPAPYRPVRSPSGNHSPTARNIGNSPDAGPNSTRIRSAASGRDAKEKAMTGIVTPKLDEEAVRELGAAVRGPLVQPADAEYDQARSLYNAMIDKRPALIARCVDVADVIKAVSFGREQGLDIAIRGGGHNGGGLGSVDGGLVVDLSLLRGVHIDPGARVAHVSGGATLGDLDHAAHAFGLGIPAGIVSTTGVAGLTLGGGHGHLTRKYGLTVDSLRGADVVLADGTFVTAGPDRNNDLFWAIRGGGGNFGVVTSFTFDLHPVDTVIGGPMLWPLDRTEDVLRWYREFLPAAPEDVNGFFAFLVVPPVPDFPEELHMQKMCGIVWCHTGSPEQAGRDLAPAREVAGLAFDGVGPMPYPALQSVFDALYPPGLQWYWRGDFINEITDEAIAVHAEYGARLPSMHSGMHLYPVDGAAHRVGADETAFSYRDATWSGVMAGIDPDPANAEALRSWTVDYWEAHHPHSAGGAYVNFMMEEGRDRVRATYRGNHDRLARVKAHYDPDNVFHVNQNIRPATG